MVRSLADRTFQLRLARVAGAALVVAALDPLLARPGASALLLLFFRRREWNSMIQYLVQTRNYENAFRTAKLRISDWEDAFGMEGHPL